MTDCFRSIFLLLLFCGCAPVGPQPPEHLHGCGDGPACGSAFPRGRWQFVHLIDFRLPAGGGSTVIGITVLDGRALKCALTTTEGMTLFEATDNDGITVIHALPPFDQPGFAQGLMADVRALFLRPPGSPACGTFGSEPGCRFRDGDMITDVVLGDDGCHQITSWTAAGQPARTITTRDCTLRHGYRLARSLVLKSGEKGGYVLTLRLLNVQSPMDTEKPGVTDLSSPLRNNVLN